MTLCCAVLNEQQTLLCVAPGTWLQHSGYMAVQTAAGLTHDPSPMNNIQSFYLHSS